MAAYLVLARKYRSTTFDEVVGQEPIAQTLKNAVSAGRIAQAYLFTGTRGVGKTTVARILAKALNCLSAQGPTAQPCGKCDACLAIGRGEDVDVVEIDGASNRGIDEIRQLRANAILLPARSRYKVYYIDEVHMLTKEAFNALLKTLEEPPPHVKFIFATTETEKVPATILSRCQRFDFRNIPTRQIAEHLTAICKAENVPAESDALFRISRVAAGSMRDALSLLDQIISGAAAVTDAEVVRILGTPGDERMFALARCVADGDAGAALAELDGTLQAGVGLPGVVAALGEVFRNMMLAAVCGASSELIELPEAQKAAVGELAKRFTVPALVQAVGITQQTARNLRGSGVARALVEAMLVRLAAADKFVDPASLLQRLEQLSAGGGGAAGASGRGGPPPGATRNFRPGAAEAAAAPAPAAPKASPATATAPPAASPAPGLQWNETWLKANWQRVAETLMERRQMQTAGMLRVAGVVSFDGRRLVVGFSPAMETLRLRAVAAREALDAALTALAGREIQCECIAAEGVAGDSTAMSFGGLSTAEKAQLDKDPSVRAVLSLFGGQVAEYTRAASPAAAMPQPPEEDQQQ
jgi:DNA polymerase-3 subunit gamma/tau